MHQNLDYTIKCRCPWVTVGNKLYEDYHDQEWGVPVYDEHKHFEFLVLEGAQAGLSWYTILKRREEYRQAFANFNPLIVAEYDEAKIVELINNPGIIRNRLKILSAINNAKRFLEVQGEFGSFNNYIWQFVKGKTIENQWKNLSDVPSTTQVSKTLSQDLKKRGFTFVGQTVMYAYMQATGLINDHLTSCFRYEEIKKLTVK